MHEVPAFCMWRWGEARRRAARIAHWFRRGALLARRGGHIEQSWLEAARCWREAALVFARRREFRQAEGLARQALMVASRQALWDAFQAAHHAHAVALGREEGWLS